MISSFQSVSRLGKLQAIYGFSSKFRNNRFVLGGVIIVGIFSCLGVSLFGMMEDARNGLGSGGYGTVLVTAAFFFLLGGFIIFWLLRDWIKNRKVAAALFENGIAVQNQQGGIQSAAWTEIQSVQVYQLKQGGFRNYNLICRDGRVIVLPYFLEGLSQVVNMVTQNIDPVS
ncbi:MAG: hypothetical protein ACOYZ6_01105 [Chloroflexota bacterium]